MQLSWHESMRGRNEARRILRTLNLDGLDDTSALIDHVEKRIAAPITIKTLPDNFPTHVTGLITPNRQLGVTIYLPSESGVYPAHILHHEIGHLLLWEAEVKEGQTGPTSPLDCSDDYVEFVAERIAQDLSHRLLRVRTPRIEQILG